MKKICLLLIGLAFIQTGYCQDGGGSAKKFRFGLKGEPALSWFKPDVKGVESNGVRFSFNYGLMMEFALGGSDNYAFSTGLNVTSIKGKLKHPDYTVFTLDTTFSNTEASYTLTHIQLPITLKMKTNEIGYMTYFGQFGFGAGFNWKSRMDYSTTRLSGENKNEDEDVDVGKEMFPFRVSLIVGAGFEYNVSGNTSFVVGITFNNGFLNAFRGKERYFELDESDVSRVDIDDVTFDAEGEAVPVNGVKKIAVANYFALNLGIFF